VGNEAEAFTVDVEASLRSSKAYVVQAQRDNQRKARERELHAAVAHAKAELAEVTRGWRKHLKTQSQQARVRQVREKVEVAEAALISWQASR
jgi:hypothetical protein